MQISALVRSEDVDSDLTPLGQCPYNSSRPQSQRWESVLLAAKAARPRTPDQRK
jgi:hypothetical protein